MIKLINRNTGTTMWVANERVAEYLAAGHKPAVQVPEAPPYDKKAGRKKTQKK